jgi:hypothetical protein
MTDDHAAANDDTLFLAATQGDGALEVLVGRHRGLVLAALANYTSSWPCWCYPPTNRQLPLGPWHWRPDCH